MIAQVLEAQTLTQQEAQATGKHSSSRAQRIAELTIALRAKANTLMQLDLAGGDCFEQWQQLQRSVNRATWLWMALEFGKEEYRRAYHASI